MLRMVQIEKMFNEKLAPILRVLDSCETPEQLANARRWGEETLLFVADMVENRGTVPEKRFAKTYKYCVIGQMKQRYLDKQAEMTDPEVRTVIRRVAPHITICRSCGGTGLQYNRTDKSQPPCECRFCKGTGKVKVSSHVVTKVRPFVAGRDDKCEPLTM